MSTYAALKKNSRSRLDFWVESAKQDFMISVHTTMARENVSKVDLAEKIDCSPAYVSKILRGDANFTIETMVKISRALDTKLCIHLAKHHESIRWFGLVEQKAPARKQSAQESPNYWAAPETAPKRTTIYASRS